MRGYRNALNRADRRRFCLKKEGPSTTTKIELGLRRSLYTADLYMETLYRLSRLRSEDLIEIDHQWTAKNLSQAAIALRSYSAT